MWKGLQANITFSFLCEICRNVKYSQILINKYNKYFPHVHISFFQIEKNKKWRGDAVVGWMHTDGGVCISQIAVERKNSRNMSLCIRYLHMQAWTEVMWDGPLLRIRLCRFRTANEQQHCRWRKPRETIPASRRSDFRTYGAIRESDCFHHGVKDDVALINQTPHIYPDVGA